MDGRFIDKFSWVDVFDRSTGKFSRGQITEVKRSGVRVEMLDAGTTVDIPAAEIGERVRRAASAKARIDAPEAKSSRDPEQIKKDFPEGSTFEADGAEWTVRQVMDDGTVWANDGKIEDTTTMDQTANVRAWTGRDKKFAPDDLPVKSPTPYDPKAKDFDAVGPSGVTFKMNERNRVALEDAIDAHQDGPLTLWQINGPNASDLPFTGDESAAMERINDLNETYSKYGNVHTLKRTDFDVKPWQSVGTAGNSDSSSIPDPAPGAIAVWRIVGPNSSGTSFVASKEEASKSLAGFDRYNQYGHTHVLEYREVLPTAQQEITAP